MSTLAQETTARQVIDKYSPIVRGSTGLKGFVLKLLARPIDGAAGILSRISGYPFAFGVENAAGQTVQVESPIIGATLQRIERKLQDSFNTAAADGAPNRDKIHFLKDAHAAKNDVETLRPRFRAIAGPYAMAEEPYSIALREVGIDGKNHALTLDEATHRIFQEMTRSMSLEPSLESIAGEDCLPRVRARQLSIPA